MVSGQLPSKIRAYDNASTLPSDIPTYAHYLRKEGYETVLAGKMHFIVRQDCIISVPIKLTNKFRDQTSFMVMRTG